MGIYVVNKHLVVLLETRESVARREEKPRSRRRYSIACTCKARRGEDGHCIHTRAFLEDSVRPEIWKYISAREMSAPDRPHESPHYGQKATA